MDLKAQYAMVDHTKLMRLLELDSASLIEAVLEINENSTGNVLVIGKLWDGLHFMLTGVAAQETPLSLPLSKVVTGAHMFNQDDAERYFINYTTDEELPTLLKAMQRVNLTALAKKFAPALFREHNVYPDIWQENCRVALFCELSEAYENLLAFYARASKNHQNIICSIY